MKIHKDDTVQIITGKDRGQEGTVESALPNENKVVVAGVNLAKKHSRRRGRNQPGGIIEMPMPLDVSNVMLICPKCGMKARVGYQIRDGQKSRICKQCGQSVSVHS